MGGQSDVDRLARAGFGALTDEEGLALFDAALAASTPVPVPVKLDLATLRTLARTSEPAPALRGLVRVPKRRGAANAAAAAGLTATLTRLSPADQLSHLVDLVRGHVADDHTGRRLKERRRRPGVELLAGEYLDGHHFAVRCEVKELAAISTPAWSCAAAVGHQHAASPAV